MAFLFHDIVLDDTAFKTASDDMASLKQQAANLKTKLEKMKFSLQLKMFFCSRLRI